jgi:DNA topoisomerase IA
MGKYTLIITEKPEAARRIASALDVSQKARRLENEGMPYCMAMRDKEIVIVPSLGHLYSFRRSQGKKHLSCFQF